MNLKSQYLTSCLNAVIAVLACLGAYLGQTAATLGQESLFSGSENGGVEIEADDGIEWLRDLQQYRAYGNATATRGKMVLVADTLTAFYREEEGRQIIYRLDADGNVTVTSDQSEASGDKAVYHIDKKVAVLVGDSLQLITERGTITADDSLEYWDDRRIAVARGNALVIQENYRLKAGVLTAFIEETATGKTGVTRIDATSGVHISTPTDIVTGNQGVYTVAEKKITLCGSVKITRGQNQLNGECAIVNMKTGRSRLQGKQGSEKVRGLILQTE
jgi:lipopolysaccharide export system protein LptA